MRPISSEFWMRLIRLSEGVEGGSRPSSTRCSIGSYVTEAGAVLDDVFRA